MHLAELLRLRTVAGAGLLLALTQRCPLSCAHCSTESTASGVQYSGTPLRRMVGTFSPQDRPDVIFMSGGEPLLRPRLVADLATAARAAGTRSALLSGMFFARRGLPAPIRRAIATLDHLSASIDVFHEREVSREDTFAALRIILGLVPAVSLHITSSDEDYLTGLLVQVRQRFGDRVPMLVTRVQPTGRARAFVADRAEAADPGPCEFANWPLVDYDGTVYACSRQSLARLHRPPHLVLGHAARDTWPQLRRRTMVQPVLRSVRALGAMETARRAGTEACGGVCQTCVTLPATVDIPAGLEATAQQLVARLRPRDLARRWGAGAHAELAEAGW
jgi:hypothetical protein